MKIPYYQKLTLLDFPGKTAATVFTDGCNFRCPFCHNAALVVRHPENYLAPDDVFAFLKKRTGLLDGVCITGGVIAARFGGFYRANQSDGLFGQA